MAFPRWRFVSMWEEIVVKKILSELAKNSSSNSKTIHIFSAITKLFRDNPQANE